MPEDFFSPRLLAAPSFRTEAKRFIDAGPEALEWVSLIVDQTGNFVPAPEAQIQGSNLGLSPEDVLSLFRVASFVYDHAKHSKSSPKTLSGEIEKIASILKAKVGQGWEKSLTGLLTPKEKYDTQKAIDSALAQGPAVLTTFSLVVDARAVSEKEGGKLLGFVPTVLGRAIVDLDLTEEKHLDFTVGKEKLTELKETVERALSDLEALTKDLEGKLLS